jgi:hypothetical protein
MAAVINIRGVPLDTARQEVPRFKEPDGREVGIALIEQVRARTSAACAFSIK